MAELFDGQFFPGQPIQFMDGLLTPPAILAGVTALTFVNSSSSTAVTITIPGDAAAGDIAVLWDVGVNFSGGPPSDVVPTGWTPAGSYYGAGSFGASGGRFSYKILAGGDPGSGVTGINGSTGEGKAMVVYRPDVAISSVALSTVNGEATTGDPSAQVVSASGQPTPLIVLGGIGKGQVSGITFATASPAFDGEIAVNTLRFGHKLYNSSPVNHTIDIGTQTNSAVMASFYLRVS